MLRIPQQHFQVLGLLCLVSGGSCQNTVTACNFRHGEINSIDAFYDNYQNDTQIFARLEDFVNANYRVLSQFRNYRLVRAQSGAARAGDKLGYVTATFADSVPHLGEGTYVELTRKNVQLASPDDIDSYGALKYARVTDEGKNIQNCGNKKLHVVADFYVLPVTSQ